jgi:hypothetical protein
MARVRAYRGGVSVRSRGRGQSTVELALTLPVLMLLVLGIVDFGRVFVSANVLTHATRDAARYGSLNWSSVNTQSPPGIRKRIEDEATRSAVTVTDAQIDVLYLSGAADASNGEAIGCWPAAPAPDAYAAGGGGNPCGVPACPAPRPSCASPLPGDLVQVKVHLPWSAATTLIQNLLPPGFAINASAASVIEQ